MLYDGQIGGEVMNICSGTTESMVAELLDRSVCEMTAKMAGLTLTRAALSSDTPRNWLSLIIRTAGDYSASLIMRAEANVFLEITKAMKRASEVTEKDVMIYMKEYFNILCGFFVSHLNSRLHLSARFGIAEFVSGFYSPAENSDIHRILLPYKSIYGKLQLEGANLPHNNER